MHPVHVALTIQTVCMDHVQCKQLVVSIKCLYMYAPAPPMCHNRFTNTSLILHWHPFLTVTIRYLFPGRLDRNGALQLGSPPAPTSAPAGGAPEVPLSRSSRAGSEGLGRTSAVSDSLARTSRGSGLGEGPLSRSSRGPEEGLSRTSWHPEREPSAS